jgi:hypothetical protein
MRTNRSTHEQQAARLLVPFVMSAIVVSAAIGIFSLRSLYADGAWFFIKELASPGFTHGNATRIMAEWINQSFIVAALTSGIHMPLRGLAWLHGLSLYYFPAAAIITALWFSRKSVPLLVGTLLYVVLVWFQSNFFIIGEAHVFGAAAWLFFVLVLAGNYKEHAWIMAALFALSCVVSFSYEGMLFFAPVISFIIVRDVRHSRRAGHLLALTLPVFTAGVVCAVKAVISPVHPGAYGDFKVDVFHVLTNVYLHAAAAFCASSLAVCLLPLTRALKLSLSAVCALSFLVILYYIDAGATVRLHYQNRVLMAVYMPLVLVPVIYAWHRSRHCAVLSRDRLMLFALLTVGVMSAADIVSSVRYAGYAGGFCDVIRCGSSVSNIDSRFLWGWSDPLMNALLTDDPGAPLLPEMERQAEKDGWTGTALTAIRDYRVRTGQKGLCGECRRVVSGRDREPSPGETFKRAQ